MSKDAQAKPKTPSHENEQKKNKTQQGKEQTDHRKNVKKNPAERQLSGGVSEGVFLMPFGCLVDAFF